MLYQALVVRMDVEHCFFVIPIMGLVKRSKYPLKSTVEGFILFYNVII
jgi:hypothetical protein